MTEPNWDRLLEAGTVAGIIFIGALILAMTIGAVVIVTLLIAEWLFFATMFTIYGLFTWYIYREYTQEDEDNE